MQVAEVPESAQTEQKEISQKLRQSPLDLHVTMVLFEDRDLTILSRSRATADIAEHLRGLLGSLTSRTGARSLCRVEHRLSELLSVRVIHDGLKLRVDANSRATALERLGLCGRLIVGHVILGVGFLGLELDVGLAFLADALEM
jgi:hypothetical protein